MLAVLGCGVVGGAGGIAPQFQSVGKKILLSENFRPKVQNVGLKIPIFLQEFSGKIKIFSTRNTICRKFAALCPKTANFCPSFFRPTMPLLGECSKYACLGEAGGNDPHNINICADGWGHNTLGPVVLL